MRSALPLLWLWFLLASIVSAEKDEVALKPSSEGKEGNIKRVLVYRTIGGLSNVMYGFAIALEVARKQNRDLFIDATHHTLFEGMFLHNFFNFAILEEKYKLRITEDIKDLSPDLVWHADYYDKSSQGDKGDILVTRDIPIGVLVGDLNSTNSMYKLGHSFDRGTKESCLNKSQHNLQLWHHTKDTLCIILTLSIEESYAKFHPGVSNNYAGIKIPISPPPSDQDPSDVVVFATGKYKNLFNIIKLKSTPALNYAPCGVKVRAAVLKRCRSQDRIPSASNANNDKVDKDKVEEGGESINVPETIGGFTRITTGMNILKEQYIGVHFRNTDIKTDVSRTVADVVRLLEKKKKKKDKVIIYLASDDVLAFELVAGVFKKKYPQFHGIIVQYTNIPSEVAQVINSTSTSTSTSKAAGPSKWGLHHLNHDKSDVTLNMLIDMYYLTNAAVGFVGSSGSGMSGWIHHMRATDCSIYGHDHKS